PSGHQQPAAQRRAASTGSPATPRARRRRRRVDAARVIYAIETRDARRGTLTYGFGVNANSAVTAFVESLEKPSATARCADRSWDADRTVRARSVNLGLRAQRPSGERKGSRRIVAFTARVRRVATWRRRLGLGGKRSAQLPVGAHSRCTALSASA